MTTIIAIYSLTTIYVWIYYVQQICLPVLRVGTKNNKTNETICLSFK
jgi:hypothetical protein